MRCRDMRRREREQLGRIVRGGLRWLRQRIGLQQRRGRRGHGHVLGDGHADVVPGMRLDQRLLQLPRVRLERSERGLLGQPLVHVVLQLPVDLLRQPLLQLLPGVRIDG
jgi:hypothetical protein